ncbi:LOW QUALITY PROTEIN: hypothetical protein YC2023_073191 [Brassica napus]
MWIQFLGPIKETRPKCDYESNQNDIRFPSSLLCGHSGSTHGQTCLLHQPFFPIRL